MARLNREKREALRFGRPERLIDRIFCDGIVSRDDIPIESFLENLRDSKVVNADNVVDYMDSNGNEKDWNWDNIPCVKLPFKSLFIEYRFPKGRMNIPDISRVGVSIKEDDPRVFVDFVRANMDKASNDLLKDIDNISNNCAYFNSFIILLSLDFNSKIYHICQGGMFLDKYGVQIRAPIVTMASTVDTNPDFNAGALAFCSSSPAMMTLSFMNCKNVTIQIHDPDHAINRERKKHKRVPFVRYHTINIDPMRKVLRTDGDVEHNGLKKALHICRGHFATYTEDRPLFGRNVGTFWIPAHTRGSLEKGVVVSDYKVSP